MSAALNGSGWRAKEAGLFEDDLSPQRGPEIAPPRPVPQISVAQIPGDRFRDTP